MYDIQFNYLSISTKLFVYTTQLFVYTTQLFVYTTQLFVLTQGILQWHTAPWAWDPMYRKLINILFFYIVLDIM